MINASNNNLDDVVSMLRKIGEKATLAKPYIIQKVTEDAFNALKSSGINFESVVKDNQHFIRFKAENKEQVEIIINSLKTKIML